MMSVTADTGNVSRGAAAYAAAAIELYSRVWLALERLTGRSAPGEPETPLMVLRLELIVLPDACDSPSWRLMLAHEQRRELRATLESVLRMLAAPADGGWHLMQAQNRLIDAVLLHCAATRAQAASSARRTG